MHPFIFVTIVVVDLGIVTYDLWLLSSLLS